MRSPHALLFPEKALTFFPESLKERSHPRLLFFIFPYTFTLASLPLRALCMKLLLLQKYFKFFT
ncbi:MAG: hypothetical protein K2H71_00815, partial [Muribaculaceae bacterium]|nr:hypothetical protein [Muribaculaceae bacterium]